MGGRRLPAARYVIHPDVPWFARLFVKAPDQYLWYYRPDPPAFLRAEPIATMRAECSLASASAMAA